MKELDFVPEVCLNRINTTRLTQKEEEENEATTVLVRADSVDHKHSSLALVLKSKPAGRKSNCRLNAFCGEQLQCWIVVPGSDHEGLRHHLVF